MSPDYRLLVTQSEPVDGIEPKDQFVVEDRLRERTVAETRDFFGALATADVQSCGTIPLHTCLWQQLTRQRGDSPYSLIHLVILIDELVSELHDREVTYVECRNVDRPVETAVRDACEESGIPTDATTGPGLIDHFGTYLRTILGLSVFILDQFLSILLSVVVNRSGERETIFLASVGRFDSMEPVLDADSYEFEVLIPTTTLAWLWKLKRSRPDLRRFSPTPINLLVDGSVLVAEFTFLLVDLRRELVTERRYESGLRELVASTYGFDASNTIGFVVDDIITSSTVRSLLSYHLITEGIQCDSTSKLVTPGLSPLGRSALAGGAQSGYELYDVPHSMTSNFYGPMPFGTTRYVEGELAMRYVRKQSFITDIDRFRPLGRPYLAELRMEIEQRRTRQEPLEAADSGSLTVVIATQPLADDRRRTFLETTLKAVEAASNSIDVSLKPHPEEDPTFYRPLLKRSSVDVTVKTGDLLETLVAADVVISINSNVGFEAILAEAANLCVNLWEPLTWSMPYAEEGPVPILREEREVMDEIASLTSETVADLQERQLTFARENVVLSTDCATDIARSIHQGE